MNVDKAIVDRAGTSPFCADSGKDALRITEGIVAGKGAPGFVRNLQTAVTLCVPEKLVKTEAGAPDPLKLNGEVIREQQGSFNEYFQALRIFSSYMRTTCGVTKEIQVNVME